MTPRRGYVVLLAFALACPLVGCRALFRKGEPAATEVDAGVEPSAAFDESTVPTPEDFEEEAVEKVTSANFRSELARLKKDIATK